MGVVHKTHISSELHAIIAFMEIEIEKLKEELDKTKKVNKSAAQRARMLTLGIAKTFKRFRKYSSNELNMKKNLDVKV